MFFKIIFPNLILLIYIFLSTTKAQKIYFIDESNYLNWNDAKAQCQKFGFNLISIKTRIEFEALKKYIKNEYGRVFPYWLGGYRLNGTFVWISSGEKIERFFWHQGEPNDRSGEENCIHTWEKDFDWNDNDCEKKLPFICDKEV